MKDILYFLLNKPVVVINEDMCNAIFSSSEKVLSLKGTRIRCNIIH